MTIRADEGDARWWFGALAVVKATAADTGGAMSIVEVTEPPGAEAPLHVHHREDEGFWILDGDITFEVGGTTFEARAGDFAFGPRDIPHRYKVGDAGCRMLFLLTPGGFEGAIIETSTPARSRTLPPASEPSADIDTIQECVASYGCELLG
jgi:quercetin dioxygenase-like cupin family protein